MKPADFSYKLRDILSRFAKDSGASKDIGAPLDIAEGEVNALIAISQLDEVQIEPGNYKGRPIRG